MRPLAVLASLLAVPLLAVPSLAAATIDVTAYSQERRLRIVDAETGEPIHGATADRVPEIPTPAWGKFWSTATGQSNEKGLVTLPPRDPDARSSWLIVTAKGYAPFGGQGADRVSPGWREVRLWPVVPAQVRILDYLGRPIPMVHLGVTVGCGHTPDVTSAVTDREGRATLYAVGRTGWRIADVYPVGAGVRGLEADVDWDAAIQAPLDVRVSPGIELHGRVLGPDGTPVAGVTVGTRESHRGPQSVTDSSGRFHLFGLFPRGPSHLVVTDKNENLLGFFEGSIPGVERILRLPEALGDKERPGALTDLTVKLDIVGYRAEGKALWPDKIPVTVWDAATGWMEDEEATPGTPLEFKLAPGRYRIRFGGPSSPFAEVVRGPFDVLAGTPMEISEVLPPIEAIRLELHDIGEAQELLLVHPDGMHQIFGIKHRITSAEGHPKGNPEGNSDRGVTGIIDPFVMPEDTPGLWLRAGGEGAHSIPFAIEPMAADASPFVLHARRR